MTNSSQRHLTELVDAAEQIGVIGSPSSTSELAIDVLAGAVARKLVGELALFRYLQDNQQHYALGQITEVKLRNIWHEDPTMRSLIRQRGRVDAVSERQDTHLAEMAVSAVFAATQDRYHPSILGTAPATGTATCLVDDNVLDELLTPYRQELFYLGHVYGSRPKLPMWLKHFASGAGGAGEAYHIGIFGKTGSGKSVLAKLLMLGYARHSEMGMLVVDPQGEFAKDARGEVTPGEFRLRLGALLSELGRSVDVVDVTNLVMDTWDLFEHILYESLLFDELTFRRGENREQAARVVRERLEDRSDTRLQDLHTREAFDQAWRILNDPNNQSVIYRSPTSLQRFQNQLAVVDTDDFYERYWQPLGELFNTGRGGARKLNSVIGGLLRAGSQQRPIVIVDLSGERAAGMLWNDTIQALVIDRMLQAVNWAAEAAYSDGQPLNTLVLIDEAHRLAPRETPLLDELEQVRRHLIDAARTTRKYGIGWLFISQTLSSLHPEILQQLRIFFFGFGLSMGQEFNKLRELVGGRGKALDLYQRFRDPHSSFDMESREYSFMTQGPVSPLSFSGTPLFFNAFNTPEAFLEANGFTEALPNAGE